MILKFANEMILDPQQMDNEMLFGLMTAVTKEARDGDKALREELEKLADKVMAIAQTRGIKYLPMYKQLRNNMNSGVVYMEDKTITGQELLGRGRKPTKGNTTKMTLEERKEKLRRDREAKIENSTRKKAENKEENSLKDENREDDTESDKVVDEALRVLNNANSQVDGSEGDQGDKKDNLPIVEDQNIPTKVKQNEEKNEVEVMVDPNEGKVDPVEVKDAAE
jgi:hypothetical protein